MSQFFYSPERIDALRYHALRWLGTPFHDKAQQQGAGVDCVHLAAALYQATGFLGAIEFPAYSMSEGQHAKESKLISILRNHPQLAEVYSGPESEQLPGDLLCFKTFGVGEAHHCGVFIGGGEFVNAMQRYGVRVLSLSNPQWVRMLSAVYRPIET